MKKTLYFLLAFLSTGTLLQAQKCESIFSKVLSAGTDIFYAYQDMRKEVANVLLGDGLGDVAEIAIDFQTQFYETIGEVPGNGEGSVGPRYLTVPCKNITGRLQGEGVITARTFITVPTGYDKLYVTIKKTDGRAGANITVCVKDDNGLTANSKEKSIENGNNTIGVEKKFTFFGTEDKYLSIFIDKTTGLNDFAYTVKIEGEMNPDKLEDEYEAYLEDQKQPKRKLNTNIQKVDKANPTVKRKVKN